MFQMNLDMFNLPEIFFSSQTFSSFNIVFKYERQSDFGKNLFRFICVLCEEMKSMPFAIKISLNSSFAFNVNGSKNVRLNGRLPHILTSPNLALFAKCLETPGLSQKI